MKKSKQIEEWVTEGPKFKYTPTPLPGIAGIDYKPKTGKWLYLTILFFNLLALLTIIFFLIMDNT